MNIAAVMLRQGCGLVLAEVQEIGISGTARACAAYAVANPVVGGTLLVTVGTLAVAGYAYRRCQQVRAVEHARIEGAAHEAISRPGSPTAAAADAKAPARIQRVDSQSVLANSGVAVGEGAVDVSTVPPQAIEYDVKFSQLFDAHQFKATLTRLRVRFKAGETLSLADAQKICAQYTSLKSLKIRYVEQPGVEFKLPEGFREALPGVKIDVAGNKTKSRPVSIDQAAGKALAAAVAGDATQPASA